MEGLDKPRATGAGTDPGCRACSRRGTVEAPLIVLDSKSAMCMANNSKYTKHTKQISRRIIFLRNGEKCKIHKTDWCEGGLQLADISTKNVGEHDLTTRIKYVMVILDN